MITWQQDIEFLEHYGVKGMKWGVRRVRRPSGPGSDDFERTKELRNKARTEGARGLSNAELRTAIDRMNLEQQFSRLTTQKSALALGIAKVRDILSTGKTVVDVYQFAKNPLKNPPPKKKD